MHELVQLAMEAHGGLERWKKVRQITANFAAYGLGLKQRGPLGEVVSQSQMRIRIDARAQHVTIAPFLAAEQKGVYTPIRTTIEASDGTVLETLDNPREDLEKLPAGTPWSGPQILYFLGYSLWMYHTLPFTFLREGVICEDADPWIEDGETWRGLKVTYPDSFPSHSKEQIHYFDSSGIMRRQDYTVDVRQNLVIAHYLLDNARFDDFVFATKRRICLRDAEGRPLWDRTLISADLADFTVIQDEAHSDKD
jgi:hypothetical protein